MIELEIVTPSGCYLSQSVMSIHAKSVEGEFSLLSNHMPVVMALVPCKLVVEDELGEKMEYAISGGFLHFGQDKCKILTDAIENRHEIDIDRAHAAYERARARLEKIDDDTNLKRAELALKKAINRIHVHGQGATEIH